MKKGTAMLLVILFFMVFILPLPAQAAKNSVTDKQFFIESLRNASYPEATQSKFIESGAKLTGNINLNSQISAQGNDAPFSSLNINGGMNYALDMDKLQGEFDISLATQFSDVASSLNEQMTINSSIYWDHGKVIVPGQTITELAAIMNEELPAQMPRYVYLEMGENELAGFQQQLQESRNFYDVYPNYSDFYCQLFAALLIPVPDKCFSRDGNTAVLNIDKKDLVLYLLNMNNDAFIDSLVNVFKPLYPEITKYDVKEILGNISVSDAESLSRQLKDLNIKELRITIDGDQINVNSQISYNMDGDRFDLLISSQSNGLAADLNFQAGIFADNMKVNMVAESKKSNVNSVVDQNTTLQVNFNEASDYLRCNIDSNNKIQPDRADGNGIFDIKAKFGSDGFSINTDLNYTTQVKDSLQMNIPVLNSGNSISMDELFPEKLSDYEDELIIIIDGELMDLEEGVAPFIQNGRTMVPLRSVSEEYLGCNIEWIPPNQINVSCEDTLVTLYLNKNTYQINSAINTLDVQPVIVNGKTYVPLRNLGEAFNYDVEYDADLQIIYLDQR
ncbi:MAG: copper amine oxidase N-terminal domain-containing protein [Syntrophomonadaceae bacterium]|jgi:hypothetical protein